VATETLNVRLLLQSGQYKREAREAATATGKIGQAAGQTGTATGRMRDQLTSVGTVAKAALAGVAVHAVGQFVSSSVAAARDLGESINAVNKVFGDFGDSIHEFGVISAQTVGLSTREFNSLATVTGSLLKNMKFDMGEVTNQTIRLTTRASDMASVFNTDVDTALAAINSALKGEANPIEQFGVKLNDATVRAKAVELGLADTTAAVNDHGKAVATLSLIYEQTADTQGDFLQTSDDLANSLRQASAEFENSQAAFGQALQAPTTGLLHLGTNLLRSTQLSGIFGKEAVDTTAAVMRMEEAVSNVNDALREGADPLTALADSLLHLATTGKLTAGQFEALAGAAGLPIEKFEAFNDIVQAQGEAAGLDAEVLAELELAIVGSGLAAEDAEDGHAGLDETLEDEALSAEDAAAAQRDLVKAYLEAANPIFAAQSALERYRSAQESLAEAQEDGEATAEDIAAAQLDVASAALEAEGALTALAGGDINRGIGLIAEALDISDTAARDLLETLQILDGTDVTSTVTTQFRTVGTTNVGFRQHGGPVTAGRPYVIGEAGPELFVPSQSGHVVANQNMGGQATAGTTVNVFTLTWGDFVQQANKAGIDIQRLGW
jgi:hypothetical protein